MTHQTASPLSGRAAVVTGSVGRGIGRSIALRLGRAGADVVLNYGTSDQKRDRSDEISKIQENLDKAGVRSIVVEADTKSTKGVETLIDAAKSAFGSIDILINNAGAPWIEQNFADVDPQRWRDTLSAEIIGPAHLIALVLPMMRERRWGRIINIAIDFPTLEFLLDAQYGNRLFAFPYPFAIGKFARIGLTERLARAEIRYGITINSILPGIVEECDWEEAVNALDSRDEDYRFLTGPDDVARVAISLCMEPFHLVTGSQIVLPGNVFERIR